MLSFTRLWPLDPDVDREDAADQHYGTSSWEPLDPWRARAQPVVPGILKVAYGFQTRWSPPDKWVIGVARRFPTLCFVLGWVEPNMDMAGSLVTGAGPTRRYEMDAEQKERLYEKHRDEWETSRTSDPELADLDPDDAELYGDLDADSEVMDMVVGRWDRTVRRRVSGGR